MYRGIANRLTKEMTIKAPSSMHVKVKEIFMILSSLKKILQLNFFGEKFMKVSETNFVNSSHLKVFLKLLADIGFFKIIKC